MQQYLADLLLRSAIDQLNHALQHAAVLVSSKVPCFDGHTAAHVHESCSLKHQCCDPASVLAPCAGDGGGMPSGSAQTCGVEVKGPTAKLVRLFMTWLPQLWQSCLHNMPACTLPTLCATNDQHDFVVVYAVLYLNSNAIYKQGVHGQLPLLLAARAV